MNLNWSDFAHVGAFVFGLLNAWIAREIQLQVAKLRGELGERIARTETKVEMLQAAAGHTHE